MFFYSSFLTSYQSIFMLMKVILAVMCTTYLGSSENKAWKKKSGLYGIPYKPEFFFSGLIFTTA